MIDVQIEVHVPSYEQLGRPPPRTRQGGIRQGWDQAVADTDLQLDIIGSGVVHGMEIELGSLLQSQHGSLAPLKPPRLKLLGAS